MLDPIWRTAGRGSLIQVPSFRLSRPMQPPMRVVEVRGGFNLSQCVEVVGAFKGDWFFLTTPSRLCVVVEEPP